MILFLECEIYVFSLITLTEINKSLQVHNYLIYQLS